MLRKLVFLLRLGVRFSFLNISALFLLSEPLFSFRNLLLLHVQKARLLLRFHRPHAELAL